MSRKNKKKFFSGHNFTYFQKPKKAEKVEFILPLENYNKILTYAQCSPSEISGLGKMSIEMKDGKEIATVTDVKIFKQTNTGAHTTLEADALHRWLFALANGDEDHTKWNLWWHSHYNFNVFFSGEDTATISQLSKESTWFSLCVNQKGDMIARKDTNDVHIGDLSIKLDTSLDKNNYERIKKEVEELVTIEQFTSPTLGVLPYEDESSLFGHVPEAAGNNFPSEFQTSDNYLDRMRRDRKFHGVTSW
jgi:hypothetical protein